MPPGPSGLLSPEPSLGATRRPSFPRIRPRAAHPAEAEGSNDLSSTSLRPRWLAVLACVLAASCAGPPPITQLTLVTRDPGVLRPEILKRAVQAEWCFNQDIITASLTPPWRARLADRGRAISRAIDSVPGANVLTDVRIRVRVEQYLLFTRVCAIASGDAGRVE